MKYVEGNVCNNDINEENWHKRGYHTYSDVFFSLLSPSSAPPLRPGGAPPCDFSIFPPIMKTNSRYQQKSQRYSARSTLLSQNNVAIRMIATFMPNFLYLSFIQLFHIFRSSFQILKLVIIFFKLVDKSKKSLF